MVKVGDFCFYRYDNQNKSLALVEVVKLLSDVGAVVKFHKVYTDDSGNGFFSFVYRTQQTMNVSIKYLTEITTLLPPK